MLPYFTNVKPSKTIYINPNFRGQLQTETTSAPQSTNIIPRNAHINPLFLESHKYRNTIHMNPAFLEKYQEHHEQQKTIKRNMIGNELKSCLSHKTTDIVLNSSHEVGCAAETRKIICKSKNRLIREPLIKNNQLTKPAYPMQPLLVLNKRKLIRKASTFPETSNNSETKNFSDSQTVITKYKLDNRMVRKKPILPPTPKIKRTSFVGRYALKRISISENLNATAKKPLLINKNKKLQVLNINGLLYKSTRNSLKLKDIATARTLAPSKSNTSNEKCSSNINQGLTIFVRGNKYVMDANKFKLTRATNCDHSTSNRIKSNNPPKAPTCKRIDIGGYTYISTNSSKNVLIRTTNHLSRAYVHNAKHKSLLTLTKRLVKSNIPCPIFQRIGKCAAFERGKCSKVHNKLQVAICNKFLRGECLDSKCLLSHNVSLSKMPVCKFFLQGVCVRNDCPYLHKKLSDTAELCSDFLRGFCKMADKCNKRHEFVCPEIERNNICTTKNCIYCNAKRRKESQIGIKTEKQKNNIETTPMLPLSSIPAESCKRYFIDSSDITMENANERNEHYLNEEGSTRKIYDTGCSTENIMKSLKTRPKLGTLPSYIPL